MWSETTLRLLVIGLALAWAGWRFVRLAQPLLAARAEPRLTPFLPRAWSVVVNVLGHARLMRKPYSGLLHFAMFAGFLFLLTAVIQVLGEGVAPVFSLAAIGGRTWIALGQDVFAGLMLIATGMAVIQRIRAPSRFAGSNRGDAAIILALIAAVLIGMLLQNAFNIAAGGDLSAPWRPVSSWLATGLISIGLGGAAAAAGAAAFSWLHLLAILAFLVYIPGSKHLHIFAGIPNVFMRNLQPAGRLPTPDLEHVPLGLSDIGQLGRKQLLDLYACTECGRCQEVCPAHAAGKPLSPKLLIMNLRDHLFDAQDTAGEELVGGAIREETIWSCTTCSACMEACPLFIEHVPKIVDMRQHLTMEEGRVPDGISGAMLSVEQRGHPWAGTPFSRVDWCRDLDLRVLAPGELADLLLWVGCTAALDARAQRWCARWSGCCGKPAWTSPLSATPRHAPARRAPDRQRLSFPGAGSRERRDPERARLQTHRHHLSALHEHAEERIFGFRRRLRCHPPFGAAVGADGRWPAAAIARCCRCRHLSRSLLYPRPL